VDRVVADKALAFIKRFVTRRFLGTRWMVLAQGHRMRRWAAAGFRVGARLPVGAATRAARGASFAGMSAVEATHCSGSTPRTAPETQEAEEAPTPISHDLRRLREQRP